MTFGSRLRVALASLGLLLVGCYRSNAPMDGAVADGRIGDGAIVFDGDAGACDWLGSTRLCGRYCGVSCREGEVCDDDDFQVCFTPPLDDGQPRGVEECVIDPEREDAPYCYTGHLCATTRAPNPGSTRPTWTGRTCVSDEYCTWMRSQPDLAAFVCRYDDGSEVVNGPPDDECADGAAPEDPFCGGRCGDTCPANPIAPFVGDEYDRAGSCVGRSETRGFGVCVAGVRQFRCWPGQELSPSPLVVCQESLYSIAGMSDGPPPCTCMVLGTAGDPEYVDHGWAVAEQTCLAYRARYPDEVRCLRASEL